MAEVYTRRLGYAVIQDTNRHDLFTVASNTVAIVRDIVVYNASTASGAYYVLVYPAAGNFYALAGKVTMPGQEVDHTSLNQQLDPGDVVAFLGGGASPTWTVAVTCYSFPPT